MNEHPSPDSNKVQTVPKQSKPSQHQPTLSASFSHEKKFHTKQKVEKKHIVIFILIVISFFLLLALMVVYLNQRYRVNIETTSSPYSSQGSKTIERQLKTINDLRERGVYTDILRYLNNGSGWSDTTHNTRVSLEVVDVNLATGEVENIASKEWFSASLSPSGNYLHGLIEEEIIDEENITRQSEIVLNKIECHYYVTNLETNKLYHGSRSGTCGGPGGAPIHIYWMGEENAVSVGSGDLGYTLLSLPELKKLISYPSEGHSRSAGTLSFDSKYLAYEILSNFFVLEDYYGSFGIIQVNNNGAVNQKVFPISDVESNDFICWKGHEALYTKTSYEKPAEDSIGLSGKELGQQVLSYNAESGQVTELCQGNTCDTTRTQCDQATEEDKVNAEYISNLVSDPYKLNLRGGVAYNSQNNLAAFTATERESENKYEGYVYIIDLENNDVYKIGKGEQPRWL